MIVGIVAVNKIMFRLIEERSIRVRLVCVLVFLDRCGSRFSSLSSGFT